MLRVIIITYGEPPGPFIKEVTFQGAKSIDWIKHLKSTVLPNCDFIIYDNNLFFPVNMDGTCEPLAEDEVIEYLYGTAYPALEKEGLLVRRNGKYYNPKQKKPDAQIEVRGGAVLLKNMR